MLKCYFGGAYNDPEFGFRSLAFAQNIREAKKLLWAENDVREACDFEYSELKVSRFKEFDSYSNGTQEGYVVTDPETRWRMGWRYEDDLVCLCCSLAEFKGKLSVCGECEHCNICGCECED